MAKHVPIIAQYPLPEDGGLEGLRCHSTIAAHTSEQLFIDLVVGTFTVLAQKHVTMFRALNFLNKGVFSTTRTCGEFYSVSSSGFGGVSL